MTSTTHATAEADMALEPTVLPDGPILVATDTAVESDAVFPIASVLAARSSAEVIALSVVEPTNMPVYGVDGMIINLETAAETQANRQSAAHAQLLRMAPANAAWPIIVTTGEPALEITRTASKLRARLVVVGRGRHTGFDRMFGGESVLRMLQLGDTPVLAVEPTLTSPPRRIVIATDFSPFSLYAAQVALTLAASDATIWLLHVGPPFDETVPFLQGRAEEYRAQAATAFAALRGMLHTDRMAIESVVLTGSAPDELIRYVSEQKADLVVSATHGYGFMRRMVLGSVAATLIRRAPCSVLVVPGSARTIAAARAQAVPNRMTRALDQDDFDAELLAFTVRNAGRRCLVEVDQADFGAQLLGHDLQLVGAAYDRHDRGVSVMFGTSTLKGMHLTHSISGVTTIDLASSSGGVDEVLRIGHASGQTLISLT